MKRFKVVLACLVIVGLLAGCASNSFLCRNGQTVINGLQAVISQANSVISLIQTTYPGVVPPAAQAVLSAAQAAKDLAQLALGKACPPDTELVAAQSKMTEANLRLTIAVSAGLMRLGK